VNVKLERVPPADFGPFGRLGNRGYILCALSATILQKRGDALESYSSECMAS
jgi:hypothetical protein